ncbi:MAG TPA: hypothetical protein PLY87_04070 [Planctomycetaceae bacterium]|nr:hypothetical protein [Planctomycetaceae bacterium]
MEAALADPRPAAKVWDDVLTKQSVTAEILAEAVSILHARRKYDAAIEAIQSGIRNDLAAPWMYDVLALEMKLAKRPAKDIARVLESRMDFANADIPQLLIAVALMSRFEAWDDAIRLCREATELNPELPESWLLARSVADKSKNPEYRVWARCGILSHVWSDDAAVLHQEARNVVTEIASQLDMAGQSADAEQIREQLREASMVDLMLVLRWVGSADLDLMVTQPDGQVCSFKNRSTTNGGRLVHDDGGSANEGSAKRFEQYICRIASNGEYTATIRFVLGKAVSGTAVLDIIQKAGSPEETRTTRTIKLGREDASVTIPIKNGRRTTP